MADGDWPWSLVSFPSLASLALQRYPTAGCTSINALLETNWPKLFSSKNLRYFQVKLLKMNLLLVKSENLFKLLVASSFFL